MSSSNSLSVWHWAWLVGWIMASRIRTMSCFQVRYITEEHSQVGQFALPWKEAVYWNAFNHVCFCAFIVSPLIVLISARTPLSVYTLFFHIYSGVYMHKSYWLKKAFDVVIGGTLSFVDPAQLNYKQVKLLYWWIHFMSISYQICHANRY